MDLERTSDWHERIGLALAPGRFLPLIRVACVVGAASLCIGLLAAVTLTAGWLRRRGYRLGTCASCRYDLTGNVSGTCPECGTPVAAAAAARGGAGDAAAAAPPGGGGRGPAA